MTKAYGTRAEHLAWSKERALEYLPDIDQAMSSFISDLGKHEELADHPVKELMFMHRMNGLLDVGKCREMIEGTN